MRAEQVGREPKDEPIYKRQRREDGRSEGKETGGTVGGAQSNIHKFIKTIFIEWRILAQCLRHNSSKISIQPRSRPPLAGPPTLLATTRMPIGRCIGLSFANPSRLDKKGSPFN